MRRFGGREAFLGLLDEVRARVPLAGIRSNVIVGFPGETEDDLAELEEFLVAARLDVVGVFGYSDEDGTEAETYGDKLPDDVVAERVSRFTALIEELNLQRAEERIGETVEVLIESVPTGEDDDEETSVVGRAAHQGPDVDGVTLLDPAQFPDVAVGDIVRAVVDRDRGDRPAGRAMLSESAPAPDPAATPVADAGAELLEHRQRPHRHPDPARPGLRLAAAARRWRPTPRCGGAAAAVFVFATATDRVDGDIAAQARPDHQLRQDRRPDRRQDPDGDGVRRAVGAR